MPKCDDHDVVVVNTMDIMILHCGNHNVPVMMPTCDDHKRASDDAPL